MPCTRPPSAGNLAALPHELLVHVLSFTTVDESLASLRLLAVPALRRALQQHVEQHASSSMPALSLGAEEAPAYINFISRHPQTVLRFHLLCVPRIDEETLCILSAGHRAVCVDERLQQQQPLSKQPQPSLSRHLRLAVLVWHASPGSDALPTFLAQHLLPGCLRVLDYCPCIHVPSASLFGAPFRESVRGALESVVECPHTPFRAEERNDLLSLLPRVQRAYLAGEQLPPALPPLLASLDLAHLRIEQQPWPATATRPLRRISLSFSALPPPRSWVPPSLQTLVLTSCQPVSLRDLCTCAPLLRTLVLGSLPELDDSALICATTTLRHLCVLVFDACSGLALDVGADCVFPRPSRLRLLGVTHTPAAAGRLFDMLTSPSLLSNAPELRYVDARDDREPARCWHRSRAKDPFAPVPPAELERAMHHWTARR